MIQQVQVKFAGEWVTLAYNAASRLWEGEITPEATSYNQPGGYYAIDVEAVNDTGASIIDTDKMQLVVHERDSPTITLISPAEGYVTTKLPEIILTVKDESGGSGISLDSLSVTVDKTGVSGLNIQAVSGGYRIRFVPPTELSEGKHNVIIQASDNDGNTSQLSIVYTVDTLPPELFLEKPGGRSVVDTSTIEISGRVYDVNLPLTVKIETEAQRVWETVVEDSQGAFLCELPLEPGGNYFSVTVIDGAGLESSQSLTIIRLITGRTQAHVNALAALNAKPVESWTSSERAQYLAGACWGGYTYTDLNRVTLAVLHLAEKFEEYGYHVDLSPAPAIWQKEDYPTKPLMEAYLSNVEKMRRLINIPISLPKKMELLDYKGANNIEQALVMLDSYGLYNINTFFSGEIYAGEA